VFESCLAKLTAHALHLLVQSSASQLKADRRRGGSRQVWTVKESARDPALSMLVNPTGARRSREL
jgi:hypothetical protein